MLVVVKKRALNTLIKTAIFIESQYTEGSGDRRMTKMEKKIFQLAESKAKFSICKAPQLAKYNYQCYSYNGWVIVFKSTNKKFEVCRIIWGAYLNY